MDLRSIKVIHCWHTSESLGATSVLLISGQRNIYKKWGRSSCGWEEEWFERLDTPLRDIITSLVMYRLIQWVQWFQNTIYHRAKETLFFSDVLLEMKIGWETLTLYKGKWSDRLVSLVILVKSTPKHSHFLGNNLLAGETVSLRSSKLQALPERHPSWEGLQLWRSSPNSGVLVSGTSASFIKPCPSIHILWARKAGFGSVLCLIFCLLILVKIGWVIGDID